jgi:NADP-reducing hydrogenase subunit HndB
MKSLDELNKIREEALKRVTLRQSDAQYRIMIGMATCGIAAGARPVLKAFMDAIDKDKLPCIVQQTGCIGMCIHEPIVEIIDQAGTKTTYLDVNVARAKEIIDRHLKHHEVIPEYTYILK